MKSSVKFCLATLSNSRAEFNFSTKKFSSSTLTVFRNMESLKSAMMIAATNNEDMGVITLQQITSFGNRRILDKEIEKFFKNKKRSAARLRTRQP